MTSSLNPLALPLAQQDSLSKSDSVSSLTSNQTTLMSSLAGASTPTAEPGMVDASGVAPLNTVIDLVGGAVQHLRLAVNPQAASTSIIDLGSNVPYFLDAPKAPLGTQPLAMTALPGSAIAVDASYIPPSPATIIPNGSPTVAATLVSSITGGMKINLVWDSTITSSTSSGLAFQASMVAAAQLLCNTMSDKITINLGITCSGTGGGAMAGPSNNGIFVGYATVKADLVAKKTPGDTTFDNLPATLVQGQTQVVVWGAQEKALGMLDGAATGLDGSATFATDIAPNLLLGVALHELTHAMGRVPYGPQPDIFDLFRFSSPGVMLFAQNIPSSVAYFSLDAGRTNLINFGVTSDPSDFFQATGNDPFSEYYTASTLQTLTAVDKKMLDALGFHVGVLPPTPPTKGNIVTFLANLSTIEATSYALTDSSANIALNIDALHAHLGLIASITQNSPAAALALSATQLTTDADVLTKIGTYKATVSGVAAANVSTVLSNSNVTSLAVSDTSANLVANLDALHTNNAKVTAIVVSPAAPLGLSATQFTADADVLTKIGTYTATVSGVLAGSIGTVFTNPKVLSLGVLDTSANVVSNIAALQTNIGKITSIVLSSPAPLALTAAQLTTDAGVLTKIGTYTATVSGVAAANVGSVLSNSNVTSLAVSDTGTNLVANLDTLHTNIAKITAIAVTPAAVLALSATQLSADADVLTKMSTYSATVSGVAAANVGSVLSNSKVTSLAVSDTSADIVTNIAALQANIAKITAIVVSPAAPLGLSATQFSADATALTKMGAYTATVSGVLAVNVGAVLSNTHVTSIVVSDTSANIVANLDAIQKLVAIPANSAKISSIASSDGQNLNVSATQLASDSTALAKVKFSDISVTGIVPNSSQTLSGSLGNVIFNFGVAMPGSPTALRLDTINSWSGHDEISFSSPLNIVGSSAAPKSGMASIASTGFATFVPGDSSVALQLAAVENALAYGQPTGVVAMGDLAMWFNGADAYVLITSNHTGTGVGSNDTFIKLAGVNSTDRLVFASGVIAV